MDYSHLKGKEVIMRGVKLWAATNSYRTKGFVADIDFKRGITIKAMNGKDLLCLNRSEIQTEERRKKYRKEFNFVVKAIKKGKYEEIADPFQQGGFGGDMNCAFE